MRSAFAKFLIAAVVATGTGLTNVAPANAAACTNIPSGTGTYVDPYVMTTQSHLQSITDCYYSGTSYFKLGSNIRLTGDWVPINLGTRGFILEGDNYEISGLEIQGALSTAALFTGSSTNPSSIKNLVVSAGDISSASTTSKVATLVGGTSALWTIDNVHITVNSISGGATVAGFIAEAAGASTRISNSSIRILDSISGSSATSQIAGVAAYINGTVSNTHVFGNISGASSADSSLTVGGLVAKTYNTTSAVTEVSDSSFTGSLTGNGAASSKIGGAIGNHLIANGSTNYSKILRTSVRGEISGAKFMGGLLGYVPDASSSTSPNVTIEDSVFKGSINASISDLNPWMGGVVGKFDDFNPADQSISLNRNYSSVQFLGTGSATVGAIYSETPTTRAVSTAQLLDNIYDSTVLASSTYTGGTILGRNPAHADADVKGITTLDLTSSSNYPASFNIRSSDTVPDLATTPRVNIWGMCSAPGFVSMALADLETTAFLLTESRRCESVSVPVMNVYPAQTVAVGSAITPVYPNAIPVTESDALRGNWYSVSPELPAGLSLHPRTGKLVGTPATVDDTQYTLTSTNGASTRTSSFVLMLDTAAPEIQSTSPANSATGVSPAANIVVTFDETVTAGTNKKIRILRSGDNSLVAELDLADPQVAISGNQLTIDLSGNLPEGVSLTLEIDPSAVIDESGNNFAGLAAGAIIFTTSDTSAPALISSEPANNGTALPAISEISLVFSEAVNIGTASAGQLALYMTSDDSLVEDFDLTDGNIVAVTGATVTIALSAELIVGESYYLTAPASAFVDAANNSFSGLAQNALSFSINPISSVPAPYLGPVVKLVDPNPAMPGETVLMTGSNLQGVSSIAIDGYLIRAIAQDTSVSFVLPLTVHPGTWDIVLMGDFGTLTVQDTLKVIEQVESISSGGSESFWTKRLGNTVKVYAKNVVGVGKVQFFHQGREFAWVRAVDETDPKLRLASDSYYLVRTYTLVPGKNAFEIYLDGERLWRAAYSLK